MYVELSVVRMSKKKIPVFARNGFPCYLLCSDGISTVGKYTEGRRDDVRIPFSVLKSAKFFSL